MNGTRTAKRVRAGSLQHGDVIHVGPHQVFRHTSAPHTVTCREADIEVDAVVPVDGVVVICYGRCPGPCGAVVYDCDYRVTRRGVAA